MEIEAIYKEKEALRAQINAMLDQFHKSTGLIVTMVDVRVETIRSYGQSLTDPPAFVLTTVDLKVELP